MIRPALNLEHPLPTDSFTDHMLRGAKYMLEQLRCFRRANGKPIYSEPEEYAQWEAQRREELPQGPQERHASDRSESPARLLVYGGNRMTPTVQTLRGAWRRKTNVRALPEHPAERTEAFRRYLEHVGAPDSARPALQLILRVMTPCELSQITFIHIDHAIDKLLADGYKPSSVERYRKILNAWMRWCVDRGYIKKNPTVEAKKVDMRQVKKFSPKSVPDEIRDALDEYFRNPEVATVEEQFLWAGIKSGMRISEIAMATAGDIEMKPIPGGGYKPYLWMGTKTEKRLVDFPQWVTPALLALLEAAHGDPTHPLLYLNGHKVVFDRTKGTIRVRALRARDILYSAQRKLFGKPVANPHAFRSDYITRALKRHPDFLTLEAVARRCGHDPEILREYYADLLGAGPADLAEI